MVSNDRRNSIHDTSELHTNRTRLSEKKANNKCVEENNDSLFAVQKMKPVNAKMNGISLNLDSNSDSDFKL